MPLTRGTIVGYDVELMILRFTMVDASARIVDCAISGSALDQLFGEKRSAGPADRQIQFLKHRDAIEELASAQFDARPSGTHPTSAVLPDAGYFANRVTLSLALRSSGDAGRGVGRIGAAAALVAG